MNTAIMQPYFFPYIGYFQLISAVDVFILYDNIQYIKKGWINRNRILSNGSTVLITLPIQRDSDYINVCERVIASDFNRIKLLNKIRGAYSNAPYFKQTFPLIEKVIKNEDHNVFRFLHYSIMQVCEHLNIRTKIAKSSDIDIDHNLKAQDKVLALCDAVGTATYINAIGGTDLYSTDKFMETGIDLKFIKSHPIEYKQFRHDFSPWLSIIDVMMFNSIDAINVYLSNYDLIRGK